MLIRYYYIKETPCNINLVVVSIALLLYAVKENKHRIGWYCQRMPALQERATVKSQQEASQPCRDIRQFHFRHSRTSSCQTCMSFYNKFVIHLQHLFGCVKEVTRRQNALYQLQRDYNRVAEIPLRLSHVSTSIPDWMGMLRSSKRHSSMSNTIAILWL